MFSRMHAPHMFKCLSFVVSQRSFSARFMKGRSMFVFLAADTSKNCKLSFFAISLACVGSTVRAVPRSFLVEIKTPELRQKEINIYRVPE